VATLRRLLDSDTQVALTDMIWMELLQGAEHDEDVAAVRASLSPCVLLRSKSPNDFEAGADVYRAARRAGHTIRRPQDCLIAAVCLRERVPLLHDDRDFERIAAVSELEVVPV